MGGLIPSRNPKALAGYYCGVFSLVPIFGLVLAPVAIILGILGLRYERIHPEAKGGYHALIALVFGTLSLLCNPLVALVAAWLYAT
jgi:hypothetical protein